LVVIPKQKRRRQRRYGRKKDRDRIVFGSDIQDKVIVFV
jgi:hypothetical protein